MDDVENQERLVAELMLARSANATVEAEEAAARAEIALGRILETKDHLAEAAQCYERVWENRTRHASVPQHAAHAALNLGWLWSFSGRTEEARDWYERAYALRASGPAAQEAARLSVVSLLMLSELERNDEDCKKWWCCLVDGGWTKLHQPTSDPRLELTPPQTERLAAFLDECVEMGRSTRPADRERAEDGIARIYAVSGRARPRFIWCHSPAECLWVLAGRGLDLARQLSFDLLVPRAKALSWPYTRSQLGRELAGSPLGHEAHSFVDARLRVALSNHVWRALEESARAGTARFRPSNARYTYQNRGPHDAAYFVSRWFCRRELNVRFPASLCEILDCWDAVVRSCGSWFPFDDLCLVSERPSALRFDQRGLIHSPDDYALAFRDGFAFCAWHGVRVPAGWIFDKAKVDPRLALTWSNIEQRRALGEIIGLERILAILPHSVVDRDRDPGVGTLLRVALPDTLPAQFLRVRCGTGRHFILRVPPDVTTARQANAWTYGLDATEYTPEVRT